MARKFDLLIFGATGFTGQFVVERLARMVDKQRLPLTWAVASRSSASLKQTMNEVSSVTGLKSLNHIPIFEANVNDIGSMDKVFAQSKLVLNCTGPYSLLGEPVIQSCVNTETHYMDLSGEPLFLERMQIKYDEVARKRNISIVGSCGFDSIPADLGTAYLKSEFNGELNQIEHYLQMWTKSRRFSYATWNALVEGFKCREQLKGVRKQIFANTKPYDWLVKLNRRTLTRNQFGLCVPFPGSDRSVVFRSQMHRYNQTGETPVQFEAYCSFPPWILFKLILTNFNLKLMTKFDFGEKLLLDYSRFFSFGVFEKNVKPIREDLEQDRFRITLVGKGWPKGTDRKSANNMTKCSAVIIDGRDIAYFDTSIIAVETALVLLEKIQSGTIKPGVVTPNIAIEHTELVPKLTEQGVKFAFVSDYKMD